MGVNVGWKGKIYINTGGDTVTLQELKNVMNVKIPNSMNTDDATTRGDQGVETEVPTTQKAGATWKMLNKGSTDPDLTAIRTAFYARSPLDLYFLDGIATATTSRGVRLYGFVKKFDEDQDNPKADAFDVEVAPTPTEDGTAPVAPLSGNASWTISDGS